MIEILLHLRIRYRPMNLAQKIRPIKIERKSGEGRLGRLYQTRHLMESLCKRFFKPARTCERVNCQINCHSILTF